uniref:Neur_chan_memb domain-containing protein n=1 Tax=Ascaris lumbricoides TaxID=6252 RepID=A0A0M3IRG9_ASCLU
MESSYKIGQFSCLEGNIHLRRSIGYNLVQSFIPTGLIVIISWVSFWIDRRAVPARVTLSFTTLLSITTIGNGLRFGLPQVSYAKAIDYWFGACMLFIFCVLLEFAIVNSYMRQSEKYARLARKSADTESETFVDVDAINSLRSSQSKFMKKMQLQLQQNEIPEYKYNDLLKRNIMGENLESEQRLDCNAIELQYQGKSQGAMISSVYDNVNNEKCDDIEAIECENGESTKLLTTQYRDETLTKLLSPRVGASQSSTPPPQWSNKNTRAYPYTAEQYAKLAMRFSRRALLIDKICRYVFPALFILWNLVYWCYYLMLY